VSGGVDTLELVEVDESYVRAKLEWRNPIPSYLSVAKIGKVK